MEDFATNSSGVLGGTRKPALGAALTLGIGGFVGVGRGVAVGIGALVGVGVSIGIGVRDTDSVSVASVDGDEAGTDAHAIAMSMNMHILDRA